MKTTTLLLSFLLAVFVRLPATTLADDYDYCEPIIGWFITHYGDGTAHEIVFQVSQIDNNCEDGLLSFTDGLQKHTYYPASNYHDYQSVSAEGVYDVISWNPFIYTVTLDVTDQFVDGYYWYRMWAKQTYGDGAGSFEITVFTDWIEGTDPVVLTQIAKGSLNDTFQSPQLDEPPYPNTRTDGIKR